MATDTHDHNHQPRHPGLFPRASLPVVLALGIALDAVSTIMAVGHPRLSEATPLVATAHDTLGVVSGVALVGAVAFVGIALAIETCGALATRLYPGAAGRLRQGAYLAAGGAFALFAVQNTIQHLLLFLL